MHISTSLASGSAPMVPAVENAVVAGLLARLTTQLAAPQAPECMRRVETDLRRMVEMLDR